MSRFVLMELKAFRGNLVFESLSVLSFVFGFYRMLREFSLLCRVFKQVDGVAVQRGLGCSFWAWGMGA